MKVSPVNEIVRVPIGSIDLEGELIIPANGKGIVLFAQGSGSSRFSPRNQFVAHALRAKQFGTFLIDLLPQLKALQIIPGATHLFEEAGALEKVTDLAGDWFLKYFPGPL